jgi:hypothetical protein
MTYDDAVTWADDMKRALTDKIMPPWKPVPGHGDFKDSYGLSDEERQTILDWLAAGTPQGDLADMPEVPAVTSEWQLGDPDLVVQMSQSFDVPRSKDTYRCFVIPTGLEEDKYVSAVQVIPGDRKIVHHVILFLDSSGSADKLEGRDGNPGYSCFGGPGFDIGGDVSDLAGLLDFGIGLGGWVPGTRVRHLPDGIGLFLPKKAKIVMQVHYFPAGHPGPDQTKVGIYFSRKAVDQRLRYVPIVNTTFKLQPGDANKEVTASFPVPFLLDAHAVQIAPHMHLLGRQIKMEVQHRNKPTEDLSYINDWDFNWQGFYNFIDPVALPAGAVIKLTCTFDNTKDNPKNPSDPLKVVTWGEGTEDEMCLSFLGVTFDREHLNLFRQNNPLK